MNKPVSEHFRLRASQNTMEKFRIAQFQSLNPHQRYAAIFFAKTNFALAAQRSTSHILYIPTIANEAT
ncbi:MAG TPA: hypothetical protein VGM36_06490 [Rhizomicrobium sp.]|jgi:hypothetical protein